MFCCLLVLSLFTRLCPAGLEIQVLGVWLYICSNWYWSCLLWTMWLCSFVECGQQQSCCLGKEHIRNLMKVKSSFVRCILDKCCWCLGITVRWSSSYPGSREGDALNESLSNVTLRHVHRSRTISKLGAQNNLAEARKKSLILFENHLQFACPRRRHPLAAFWRANRPTSWEPWLLPATTVASTPTVCRHCTKHCWTLSVHSLVKASH